MRPFTIFVVTACLALLCGCHTKQNAPDAGMAESQAAPQAKLSGRPVVGAFPDATEIRLFVETDIRRNGTRVFVESKGRVLTMGQRKAFEATLKIEPIPDVLAACFVPHHFFAYYDAKGKKLGEISICFCCAGAAVQGASGIEMKKDQWLSADFGELKKFVRSINLPTDVQCGASQSD